MTNHLIILVVLIIGEVWGNEKMFANPAYLSIFFPFLIFPGSRLRPKTLQAVDVPIIDNRQCERWHKSNGINVVIYDEMMCAGYRGGAKDSCQVYVYSTFFDLLGPTHNAEFNRPFSRLKWQKNI